MKFDTRRLNLFFIVLILLVLLGTCVYLVISLHVDPVNESIKTDQVLKTLFVVNSQGESLMSEFVVYYHASQKAGMLEIAGNVGAIYNSIARVDRIDAIYKELGIETYTDEVKKLLGTDIPFVIELNIDDFCLLADIMGGIKVFVPSSVDMVSQTGERYLLPSGAVLLDGDKVRTFLMYKLQDETDTDMCQRRQEAFIAFLQALHENRKVLFKTRNFKQISHLFKSELTTESIKLLLSEISCLDTEQLSPQAIMGMNRIVDDKRLLFPFYEGQLVKESVKRMISSLIIAGDNTHNRVYVLEIKNGTTTQGLARNTSVLLQSVGYDVLNTGNADRNDYDKTFIINHIGDEAAGKSLADFIHCNEIIMEDTLPDSADIDSNLNVDFTVVIGRDFDGRYVR